VNFKARLTALSTFLNHVIVETTALDECHDPGEPLDNFPEIMTTALVALGSGGRSAMWRASGKTSDLQSRTNLTVATGESRRIHAAAVIRTGRQPKDDFTTVPSEEILDTALYLGAVSTLQGDANEPLVVFGANERSLEGIEAINAVIEGDPTGKSRVGPELALSLLPKADENGFIMINKPFQRFIMGMGTFSRKQLDEHRDHRGLLDGKNLAAAAAAAPFSQSNFRRVVNIPPCEVLSSKFAHIMVAANEGRSVEAERDSALVREGLFATARPTINAVTNTVALACGRGGVTQVLERGLMALAAVYYFSNYDSPNAEVETPRPGKSNQPSSPNIGVTTPLGFIRPASCSEHQVASDCR
jgi:hypothetical protein